MLFSDENEAIIRIDVGDIDWVADGLALVAAKHRATERAEAELADHAENLASCCAVATAPRSKLTSASP